ncbi:hypothetical protein EV382_4919 [Micromonospora violae]|uniref:Uncharacterized protein n=1 Tax=Micromonospora violae TaxID=1278207 RepID=A0A4Q7UL23_9ACTN|nr:DUF6114 domain-containing protein [Micromonospora violae]RZT81634.1 hypothetical protein EV382_4919 [Micromonospora violae]
MTTANPSHARPGGPAQAWRLFRRWQRSRPFWGGLLIALAGLEMFASTRMTLNGLSFHSGATGLLSLLIPVILVTCGLLLWFTPAQRLFYSIVAAVTAVYSLIGLNLGGFFVGLLLGIVGSALAFAWTPIRPAPPEPVEADASSPGQEPPERAADEQQAIPQQPGPEPAVSEPARAEGPGHAADPRTFGIVLVVIGLAVGGLASQPQAVQAASTRPAVTACPTPSRTATPSPSGSAATPTPTPSPTRGSIIGGILDRIGDLLAGGDEEESATPSPAPTSRPSATPTTRPRPITCPSPPLGKPGTPGKPGRVEPGKPLPRIADDPNLPTVARTPSKLTGSSVKMTQLRFEGITDLHTVKGDLKVLKFSMREAVTDDFLLRADGPEGRNQRYATDRLTVSGDVAFYATRFVGKLLGIKVTLTPDLPFPDGIPITVPFSVTFTDPVIDLAYVTSNTLTARPALALTLG